MTRAYIREATEGDLEAMLDLFERVAEERLWIGTEPGFNREQYRTNWIAWLDDPANLLLVATLNDRIVGTLIVHPHVEYGPTVGMLVDSSHRQMGIGRALLDSAIDWARGRRIRALHLLVFP